MAILDYSYCNRIKGSKRNAVKQKKNVVESRLDSASLLCEAMPPDASLQQETGTSNIKSGAHGPSQQEPRGKRAHGAILMKSHGRERELTCGGCVRRKPSAGRRSSLAYACATSSTVNQKSAAACGRLTAGEDNSCRRTTRSCALEH